MTLPLIVAILLCILAGGFVGELIYRFLRPFFHDLSELQPKRPRHTIDPSERAQWTKAGAGRPRGYYRR